MSQENVEVPEPVRRLFAAFNKRDWAAFSAELDPEVEYAPVEEDATYRGAEAFTQYLDRWLEAWATFTAEVEEIQNTPTEDHAFLAIRLGGMGHGSGIEIYDPFFWVMVLRGGKVFRISEYTTRADALEAVGLRE